MKARYCPCFAVKAGAIEGSSFERRIYSYVETFFAKTLENTDFENIDLSTDNGANGLLRGGIKVSVQLLPVGAGGCVVRDPDARAPSTGDDP